MTDKKPETKQPAPEAPKPPPPPKKAKDVSSDTLAWLVESYEHNMEANAPRNLEELQILKDLLGN